MLILTRKLGETIKIGDSITITVVQMNDGQIKLGIDAPKTTPVHRGEVYERIKQENIKAAKSSVQNSKDLAMLLRKRKNKE